jgi:hypothetical protein
MDSSETQCESAKLSIMHATAAAAASSIIYGVVTHAADVF